MKHLNYRADVHIRIWHTVTILLAALLQGLAFAHVLERPSKLLYDPTFYLTLQKTLYTYWGPPNIGGFLEPAVIFATFVLVVLVRKDKSTFRLVLAAGSALLLAFPVVFFLLVAPANKVFMSELAGEIPNNFLYFRDNWETGHVFRFILQFIALALLVFAILPKTKNAA